MRIGCGCVKLGSASEAGTPRDHVRLVQQAFDDGVTLFDTADAYGSGASERVIGAALDRRRSEVTIATKGGYVFRPRSSTEQRARRLAGRSASVIARRSRGPTGDAGPSDRGAYSDKNFSPEHLRTALEASLRRLRTDYVDVYQLHGPSDVLPTLLHELADLQRRGLVGSIGVGAESIAVASAWAVRPEVNVVQLPFGVLDPHPGPAWTPEAVATHTTQAWVRGVLGGGVLAAAMRDGLEAIAAHPKRGTVAALMSVADQAALGLDELALRWALGHAWPAAMLIGISTPDHLSRNLDLLRRGPLDAATMDVVALALGDR